MDTLDYSKLSIFFLGGMKSDYLCMELNDDHFLVGDTVPPLGCSDLEFKTILPLQCCIDQA